jgi:hypothetical protein
MDRPATQTDHVSLPRHAPVATPAPDSTVGPVVVVPGRGGIKPLPIPDLMTQRVMASVGIDPGRYRVDLQAREDGIADVVVRRFDHAEPRPWGLALSAEVLSAALSHGLATRSDFLRTVQAMGSGITHADTYYLREKSFALAKQLVREHGRRLARLEKGGGPDLQTLLMAQHRQRSESSRVTEDLQSLTWTDAVRQVDQATSWEDLDRRLAHAPGDEPRHARTLVLAVLAAPQELADRAAAAKAGHQERRQRLDQQAAEMDGLAEFVKRPWRPLDNTARAALATTDHPHAAEVLTLLDQRTAQADQPWYRNLLGSWNNRRLGARAESVLDVWARERERLLGDQQALATCQKRHQEALGDLAAITDQVRADERGISGGTIRTIATVARLISDGVRDRGSVTNPSMTSRDEDERVLADISAAAVEGSLRHIARHSGEIPNREAFAFHQVLANAIRAVPAQETYRFADLMDLSRQAIIDLACQDPDLASDPLAAKRRAADRLRGITLQATEEMAAMDRPEATASRVMVRFIDRAAPDPRDAFRRKVAGAPDGVPVWSTHQADGIECRVWTAPIEEIFHLDHDPELLALHLGFGGTRSQGTVVIHDARHDRHSRILPATRDSVADFTAAAAAPLLAARGVDPSAVRDVCRDAMSDAHDDDYVALRLGPLADQMAATGKSLRDPVTKAWMETNASTPMLVRWAAEVQVGANPHFRGGITQQGDVIGCREFFLFTGNRMGANAIILDAPLIDFSDHNGSVQAAGQALDQVMSQVGTLTDREREDETLNPFAPLRPGTLTIQDAFSTSR